MKYQILICGDERQLLATRELILSRAGYRVVSPCTADEVAAVPESTEIDLAVIGHSLVEEEQTTVADRISSRWPSAKLLYLIRTDDALVQLSDREFQCGVHSPSKLIANCQHILESRVRDRLDVESSVVSAHE